MQVVFLIMFVLNGANLMEAPRIVGSLESAVAVVQAVKAEIPDAVVKIEVGVQGPECTPGGEILGGVEGKNPNLAHLKWLCERRLEGSRLPMPIPSR